MATISSNISSRARGAVYASNSRGRLWFSTSRVSRAGSGSFFNLGGLGASREAQYLSKERGIPRTEYNSNIHLIRSSEVDPFAPVPGSTRAAAARAAARAEAERERLASPIAAAAHQRGANKFAHGFVTTHSGAPAGGVHVAGLEHQLQAVRDELAEVKRSLLVARLKAERASDARTSETSTASRLLSTAIILTAVYIIAREVGERFTGSPKPVDGLLQAAQTPTDKVDEAIAQRQRDAPLEEQVLAESGLTAFENQPEVVEPPRRSVLSGIFWART